MDSKTKVAGPLAAAGAVSLGLVFIGACGIGQEDTYVPPPPIHSGPQAVEQAGYADPTSTTVAQVLIPPSPSWRMAPEPPPRRTLPPEYQISVTSSAPQSTGPGDSPDEDESTTRRPTLSATPGPDSATTSLPAPEIEPAHRESPVPTPVPGVPTESAAEPAPAPTSEPPATPEPTTGPATPGRQPTPGTEPARTTLVPPASETEQTAPYVFPSPTAETTSPAATTPETTAPQTAAPDTYAPESTAPGTTPVPPVTIVPTAPLNFGY
ncbi:hypothetical protein [Nocardia sp. NPDC051750]|uniref:hypothetical protein n=1 Tax=Nocardia sp. NPDC051750 TaxID=3364325 RepID=UPI0037AE5B52